MDEFFCDGSCKNGNIGMGVIYSNPQGVIETHCLSEKKEDGTSAEAEFYAIDMAMELIETKNIKKAIIYTDSGNVLLINDKILNNESFKAIQGSERLIRWTKKIISGEIKIKRIDEKHSFYHSFSHNLSQNYLKNYTPLLTKIGTLENFEVAKIIINETKWECKIADVISEASTPRSAFHHAFKSFKEKNTNKKVVLSLFDAEYFYFLEGNRKRIVELRNLFNEGEIIFLDIEKNMKKKKGEEILY